jgi:hypothetical protein
MREPRAFDAVGQAGLVARFDDESVRSIHNRGKISIGIFWPDGRPDDQQRTSPLFALQACVRMKKGVSFR